MEEENPLRKEAKELGIEFAHNIKDNTLKTKIEEHKASLAFVFTAPIEDIKIEEEEKEIAIQRISSCGNYKTKIYGYKEAARRSNLTVEEVKEAIVSGNATGTYTFIEVK